jgi:hypothetical protein
LLLNNAFIQLQCYAHPRNATRSFYYTEQQRQEQARRKESELADRRGVAETHHASAPCLRKQDSKLAVSPPPVTVTDVNVNVKPTKNTNHTRSEPNLNGKERDSNNTVVDLYVLAGQAEHAPTSESVELLTSIPVRSELKKCHASIL